jgi:hypothetical protein
MAMNGGKAKKLAVSSAGSFEEWLWSSSEELAPVLPVPGVPVSASKRSECPKVAGYGEVHFGGGATRYGRDSISQPLWRKDVSTVVGSNKDILETAGV